MRGPVPRVAVWLVSLTLPRQVAEDVCGELQERWHHDTSSSVGARLRIVALALAIASHGLRDRLRGSVVDESPWGGNDMVGTWWHDVRFAVRLALRHRTRSLAAITTLALGLGAATALFSVVRAWLLEPLPFRDPHQLVAVWETVPSASIFENTPAPAILSGWRARSTSFEGLAALTVGTANLTGLGEPERLSRVLASPELFKVLGIAPAAGRLFLDAEGRAPAPNVVLLTHEFWRRRFAADPAIVGQSLQLDGRPVEIVGVLPPKVHLFDLRADVWTPLAFDASAAQDFNRYLWVVGRLRPGVTAAAASSELDQLSLSESKNTVGANVVDLRTQMLGTLEQDVLLLFSASLLVLILACANVASLTLAGAVGRRQEMTVRLALGASRMRVLRHVLIESLVLGVAGALAGLLLARWTVSGILALSPPALHLGDASVLDPVVFVFAVTATLATSLFVGLVPAWRATRMDISNAIGATTRSVAGGRQRVLQSLVVAEVTIALALLIAAGLIFRSFTNLTQVDLGFRTANLVMFDLPRPMTTPPGPEGPAFFAAVEQSLRDHGIQEVALSQALPIRAVGAMGAGFQVEGRTGDGSRILSYWRVVNHDYFRTLGLRVTAGRALAPTDQLDTPDVAVVTESFARRAWPDSTAIGKRIGWGNLDRPLTVVGVVTDVRHSRFTTPGPHVYMPFTQVLARLPHQVAVRSDRPVADTIDAIQRAVRAVDPNQPVASIATSEQLLWRSMARRRLHLTLLGLFASVSIILAFVGVYGVLSFLVGQRRREVSIRMALGASTDVVRWLWLRQAAIMVGLGLVFGSLLGRWIGGLLGNLLHGVTPLDVPTFAVAVVSVAVAGTAAALLPARHATRINPNETLRAE